MIVREGRSYVLYTHDGARVLGRHPTRAAALAQERAVHAAKARRARRNPAEVPLDLWAKAPGERADKYRAALLGYADVMRRLVRDAAGTVAATRRAGPGELLRGSPADRARLYGALARLVRDALALEFVHGMLANDVFAPHQTTQHQFARKTAATRGSPTATLAELRDLYEAFAAADAAFEARPEIAAERARAPLGDPAELDAAFDGMDHVVAAMQADLAGDRPDLAGWRVRQLDSWLGIALRFAGAPAVADAFEAVTDGSRRVHPSDVSRKAAAAERRARSGVAFRGRRYPPARA